MTDFRPAVPLIPIVLLWAAPAAALDYVTIRQGDSERELAGKVEVEAQDGGVLFLTPDGALWLVKKEDLVSRRADDKPFVPLTRDELVNQLAAELPNFKIHKTQHYLIAYDTAPAYAQWVGSLFERLHVAFYNYWTRKGAVLHEPRFPLVAVVFGSEAAYAQHARRELGERAATIIGYYSLQTNRMTMYDLTGVAAAAKIRELLSQPRAERTVATIVHEATHQIAFNSGLQVRFADMPFWVSEGIAIYFETPDLKSAKGWQKIGAVNGVNLRQFREALPTWPGLETLLTDDLRFRDPAVSASAYAQGWALSYFLIRTRSEAYVKYLRALAEQTPQVEVEPAERIAQFQRFFSEDLKALEAEFLRYMQGVQ